MTIPNIVWQHYEDPYHRGSCDNPSHGGESACEQTGCRVAIEFRLDPLSGLCAEAWFDGEGCPMCEGLASILVERLEQRVELGGAVDWNGVTPESGPWDRQLRANLLETIGVPAYDEVLEAACMEIPFRAWLAALQSGEDEAAAEDWPHFGGPSLGEEA